MNLAVEEPGLVGLLAPNPGPMTLDGTNTWVIGDPHGSVVVDPGPADEGHLERVLAVAGRITVILLTHRHRDHSDAAAALAARAGCAVRAVDPAFRVGETGLADGDRVRVGDQTLEVLATPGHTDDSVSLLLTGRRPLRLLTGDTVLGRGSTVIAAPDGDLGDYLVSLRRLLAVVAERDVSEILPGHGPVITRPGEVLEGYLAHRQQRLQQVRDALAGGARSAEEVVRAVYADVDPSLWPAATQSVQAQLRYLDAGN